jgi:fluoride exporter
VLTDLLVGVGVGVAGGVGAVARLLVDTLVRRWASGRFPVGTELINLSGSFLLGLLTGLAAGPMLPSSVHLMVGAGLLGGYTTFSSASLETVRLLQDRRWVAGLVHGLGLVVLCTLAAAAGWALAPAVMG